MDRDSRVPGRGRASGRAAEKQAAIYVQSRGARRAQCYFQGGGNAGQHRDFGKNEGPCEFQDGGHRKFENGVGRGQSRWQSDCQRRISHGETEVQRAADEKRRLRQKAGRASRRWESGRKRKGGSFFSETRDESPWRKSRRSELVLLLERR